MPVPCRHVILLLALMVGGALAADEPLRVRVPAACKTGEQHDPYYRQLLTLALDRTVETHGPYELIESDVNVPVPERGARLLRQGKDIDVLWMVTSKGAEEHLRPVRVPLLGGLSGLRVLLIHDTQQEAMAGVRALHQLRNLRCGAVEGHVESAIFRANHLTVVEANDAESSLSMLTKQRFHYLPVSVCSQLVSNVDAQKGPLAVSGSLLIWYPCAIYFFVNPRQEELAKRLEAGLRAAIADGSLRATFRKQFAASIERLAKGNHTVVRLHNPFLPANTPLDEPALWFDITTELDAYAAD